MEWIGAKKPRQSDNEWWENKKVTKKENRLCEKDSIFYSFFAINLGRKLGKTKFSNWDAGIEKLTFSLSIVKIKGAK